MSTDRTATDDSAEIARHEPAWRVALCRGKLIVDWAQDVAAPSREEAEAEAIVRGIYRLAQLDGLDVVTLWSRPQCCSVPPAPDGWTPPELSGVSAGPRAFRVVEQDDRLAHRGLKAGDALCIDPDRPVRAGDLALIRIFDGELGAEFDQISPGLCDIDGTMSAFEQLAEEAVYVQPIGAVVAVQSFREVLAPLSVKAREQINEILANAA